MALTPERPPRAWMMACVLLIGGILLFLWKAVTRFYLKVTLDDAGLRWHDGERGHELSWADAQKLDWDPRYPGIHVAILEKDASRPRVLPFLTPALYDALRERLNPLPEHIEARIRRGDVLEVPGPEA